MWALWPEGMDLPHTQNLIQMLGLLILYIHQEDMKNFIINVTSLWGEQDRPLKQIKNALREHVKEMASGFLLWWGGKVEGESFLTRAVAFVLWIFPEPKNAGPGQAFLSACVPVGFKEGTSCRRPLDRFLLNLRERQRKINQ